MLVARAGTLLLDGHKVTEAQRFDLDPAATVDGVPMAAVYADRGGASCYDGTVRLFAAPVRRPVVQRRVGGGTCQARLKTVVANDQIVIADPPVASKAQDATRVVAASPGAVWLFDAQHGAARAAASGQEVPDLE